jgi:hypothetical protein
MVAGRKHAYPPGPKEAGFVAAVAPATDALPAAAAVSARQ